MINGLSVFMMKFYNIYLLMKMDDFVELRAT